MLQRSESVIYLSILRKTLPPTALRAYLLDVKEGEKIVRSSYFKLACISSPKSEICYKLTEV